MRNRLKQILVLLIIGCLMAPGSLAASENVEFSANFAPVRFAGVDGEADKFSAHHWVNDGYTGGLNDFEGKYKLPKGVEIDMAGHALIDENDLGGEFEVKKEGLGFVKFDYSEYRKYFSGLGGIMPNFTRLRLNKIEKELHLDIGHIAVEAGLRLEDLPKLTFEYEHEWKKGAKSRLTWTPVREGSTSRNIGPSFQEIDEVGDLFAIEAEHEVKGFELSGKQEWEFSRSENMREEASLANSATASQTQIRDQIQNPESQMASTTLGIQRWFNNDKMFASTAYHHARLTNQELEYILEMNSSRSLVNMSAFAEQVVGARAENKYKSNTYVGNFMMTPVKWLDVITKLKAEDFGRIGSSLYPKDAAAAGVPDGIINRTEDSDTRSKAHRWGEGLSLRYKAIPRTALYVDGELEQTRLWLSESRTSHAGQTAASAGEIFSRDTIDFIRNGTWVLGAHTAPFRFVNVTTHFREHRENNDYDDKYETEADTTRAKSGFFDEHNIKTDEFVTRVALRPVLWFQPSFRYQFRKDEYYSRLEDQLGVGSQMNSNTYSADLVTQVTKNMTANVSFIRRRARTYTPAAENDAIPIAPFRANWDTWLLGTEYALPHDIIFQSSMEYSQAKNFDDVSQYTVPLGVDNESLDLDVSFIIPLRKNISLNPSYKFYHFKPSHNVEAGDYNVHVVSVDLTVHWA